MPPVFSATPPPFENLSSNDCSRFSSAGAKRSASQVHMRAIQLPWAHQIYTNPRILLRSWQGFTALFPNTNRECLCRGLEGITSSLSRPPYTIRNNGREGLDVYLLPGVGTLRRDARLGNAIHVAAGSTPHSRTLAFVSRGIIDAKSRKQSHKSCVDR